MGEGERHELSRLKLTCLSFSRGLEAGPRAGQAGPGFGNGSLPALENLGQQ